MTAIAVADAPAPHRARVLALGVLAPALAGIGWILFKSMVLYPRFLGVDAWVFGRDTFVPLPAARYVANGALLYMYEPVAGLGSSIGYPYTPALPIFYAPFAGIGDRYGLTDNLLQPVARPGMFLVLAPVIAILGIVPLLVCVGRALRGYLEPARIIATQWAVAFATLSITVAYFHPEDTIAVAALIGSAHATARGKWRQAALLAAVAIAFKQWAAIPAVVLLAAAPARRRAAWAGYAYGLPILAMVPFLIATPQATTSAMTGAQATVSVGQPQLWASLFDAELVSATPLRVLWLVIAIGIATLVRGRTSLPVLFAALGLVMLARLLCEPTIFAYYLGPAFAFALLCTALQRRPLALRTACAVALQLWCGFHLLPQALWWLVLGAGVAYVCAPLLVALRPDVALRDDVVPSSRRHPVIPVPA